MMQLSRSLLCFDENVFLDDVLFRFLSINVGFVVPSLDFCDNEVFLILCFGDNDDGDEDFR